jgi:hypothetical protein
LKLKGWVGGELALKLNEFDMVLSPRLPGALFR